MTIGELVERLISLRDRNRLTLTEDGAVCDACNLLDKLPRMMSVDEAMQELPRAFSVE